jgi:AcrR family transcriptional regulator
MIAKISMQPEPPAPSTHPRSVRARAEILTATRALLAEGGLPAATVDAISARSGVSKMTIYKHWPTRTAVAAEAFGIMMAAAIPLPDTGDPVEDLREQVRRVSAFYAGEDGRVFGQLLAACKTDPEAAPYFRKYFLQARRDAIAQLWDRVRQQGAARAQVSADTVTDILFGPLIFRLMTGHAELTVEEADRISAAALHGVLDASAD